MKLFWATLGILLFGTVAYGQSLPATPAPSAPTATSPAAPPPSSKYTVLNGQKFFLLQNARRYNGSGLSPSALAVVHRAQASAVPAPPHRRAAPVPNNNNQTEEPPNNTTGTANQVLSVFAPPATAPPPNLGQPAVR